MSAVPNWPEAILPPSGMLVDYVDSGIIAPKSLSGSFSAVDFGGGGYLRIEYKGIRIKSPRSHLVWQKLRNRLNGSVLPINVPILNDYLFREYDSDFSAFDYSTHSDGSTLSDGSMYRNSTIVAVLEESAALNAGEVLIRVRQGGVLYGGETFSIFHANRGWRAYGIEEIDEFATEEDGDDTIYTAAIRAPWREATVVSDDIELKPELNFVRPLCRMILEPGTTMAWDIEGHWVSFPSVSFIEDMKRV